jgi:YD repeat-containing protein
VSDTSTAINPALPPSGPAVQYATSIAYDSLNRPTGVTFEPAPAVTAPATGANVTFAHTYNKANQRTGQTVSDNTWWAYPTGPPSTVSYTANALNQYTAVGAVTPTYDGNGNLTFDGVFTFGYDAENRLTSANGAGNTATYAYDAQGRRKSKTVNGATTMFVTDADNREVLEYDGGTGQVQRWYAYGLGPNEVLGQMNVPGNSRLTFIPDQIGSIIGVLSGAGALTKVGYAPYGKSAVISLVFSGPPSCARVSRAVVA